MTTRSFPPLMIVGAGPGDPELITLRGQQALANADVVIYTGSLVPEAMLHHCSATAERIDSASLVLEELIPLIVARIQQGLQVVRLQDGDPCLYGALYEVVSRLQDQDIAVEIVPGISAFQLAAARLGAELTVPELVQTIILTRASGRTQVPSREELASLSTHQASLCLYLSARHVREAQAQLLSGYPADTPMALCYRLGWPDEQVVLGKLSEMTELTQMHGFQRTVLYLISPALAAVGGSRSRLYSPEHKHRFRPRLSRQTIRQSSV